MIEASGQAPSLSWHELRSACTELSDGAFLATVGTDGRPHVAWVGIGFADDERLWTATYASSQKGKNLKPGGPVALHWPEQADRLVFVRATARPVTDADEVRRRWDERVLPYDQEAFYGSPENPELLFVELTPTRASIGGADPAVAPRIWRR